MASVTCKQCSSAMKQTTRVQKDYGMQLVGVVLFIIGVVLLFVFPIGTLLGVILMIGAARLGYSKKPVWLCHSCGYFFERAK